MIPNPQRCRLPEVLNEIERVMNDFLDRDDPVREKIRLELSDARQVVCSLSTRITVFDGDHP